MPTTTQAIVQTYLSTTGLTLKEFGDHFGVVHSTVINWRDGKREPDVALLVQYSKLPDWRGAFAKECLAAKGLHI